MHPKLRECGPGGRAIALDRRNSNADRLGDRTGGRRSWAPASVEAKLEAGEIIMKRSAQAQWQGDLKSGAGTISTASGTLATTPYSFHSRFEQGKGTNPEELLAAARSEERRVGKEC